MKNRVSRIAAASILAIAIPAQAAGDQPQSAGSASMAGERKMQVEMTGKPPYKRRFVSASSDSQPMLVVDDSSGTLGRIGPPSRPGRSTQSLRAIDPASEEAADFARFEEVDGKPRENSGNPARRYKGAPGKHARIRLNDD